MEKKLILGIGVFVVVFSFLAAVGHTAEPVKMVSLEPTSGVMKDIGDRMHLGVRFAVEEINAAGGLNGRPIKMLYDDTQLKPDIAARKAHRYITEERVEFIMTGTGTHVGKAMGQVADKEKVIMLNYGASGDEITGKDFTPYQFRVALSTAQMAAGLAAYYAGSPYKKFYLINQDYAFGHDVAEAFKKWMKRFKPDWQLLGEDYHPIGTKDLGPYITKINASGAEVLVTSDWGADLEVLIKQGRSLGMKAKIGNMYLADPVILPALGEGAVGSITGDIYLLTLETAQNKAFVERWRRRNLDPAHPYPAQFIGKAYQGFMFLAEAIKKAGTTKADDVIRAWEGSTYEGLIGRMFMRVCDHQVIAPMAIGEILPGANPFYKHPYVGAPLIIAAEKITVPPAETGNPRCQ
jgi:branched-chain amino acid transport system substrate-binding protein